jgi:phosphohistidine phosphatase
MQVYLIRHAHAVDAEENLARPLSPRGQDQVRALATFLKRSHLFEPAEIWHSSLVRSRETAELLAQRLRLDAPRRLMPDLEPEDDPRAVARRIKAVPHPLAIVGHEPHLSALASLLVAGRSEPPVFAMKKCAALALEGAALHWTVRWHVSPDLLA